jgi:hypothetical protein
VAAKNGSTIKCEALSDADQEEVRIKAKELHLSYVFLRQSGKQHNKLKVDLQINFTTGDNRHSKNQHLTLHLLDKHSESSLVNMTMTSKGAVFAQRGDKGNQNLSPKDKACWKHKECYHCHKKGHPSNLCHRMMNARRTRKVIRAMMTTCPVLASQADQAASTSCRSK